MTFEEFFKKKRIDLVALQQNEPALFSEFEMHFEQMGEKSFDHTKKYWFNKIRRQYQLPPEIKGEKTHAPNPLAEQTVTESLLETVTVPPISKPGYVPKFKAPAGMPKPDLTIDDKSKASSNPVADDLLPEKSAENTATPPVYKPRFNMKNIPPKRAEE